MPKIHLLNSKSISNLKLKAKKLAHARSIKLAQAQHIIAVNVGFSCWKDILVTSKYEGSCKELNIILDTKSPDYEKYLERCRDGENSLHLLRSEYKSLILNEFTDRQKIGSITRIFGLYVSNIKNCIHVYISTGKDSHFIPKEIWESNGLLEEYGFSRWLCQNDPYFRDADMDGVFYRYLALDTPDYQKVFNHLDDLGRKLDLYFGIEVCHVWINGKIDPDSLVPEDDDPKYIDYVPSAEVPKSIWRLP